MVAKKKLENTGEVTEDADVESAINEEFDVGEEVTDTTNTLESESEVTEATTEPEATTEATPEDDEQTQADLEAAGVNMDEAAEEKQQKKWKKLLLKDVEKYGMAHGSGKSSMINLAERVTEAAMRKTIYPDNTEEIYDAFRNAAEAKGQLPDVGVIPDAAVAENTPIESSEESRSSQVSKLKGFIKLGNRWDTDATDIIRRARNLHFQVLKGDRRGVRKGSTYTILCGVVSKQMARTTAQGALSDADIHEYLSVPIKPEKAADGYTKVEQALMAAVAARKGSDKSQREPIESDALEAAIENLRQCLGEGAPERLAEIDKEAADKQRAAEDKENRKNKKAA